MNILEISQINSLSTPNLMVPVVESSEKTIKRPSLPEFSVADQAVAEQFNLNIRDPETGRVTDSYLIEFPSFVSLPSEERGALLDNIKNFLNRPRFIEVKFDSKEHPDLEPLTIPFNLTNLFKIFTTEHFSDKIETMEFIGKALNEWIVGLVLLNMQAMFGDRIPADTLKAWINSVHLRDYFARKGQDEDYRMRVKDLTPRALLEALFERIIFQSVDLKEAGVQAVFARLLALYKPYLDHFLPQLSDPDSEDNGNPIKKIRKMLEECGGLFKCGEVESIRGKFSIRSFSTLSEEHKPDRSIDLIAYESLENRSLTSQDCFSLDLKRAVVDEGSLDLSCGHFQGSEVIFDIIGNVWTVHEKTVLVAMHWMRFISGSNRSLQVLERKLLEAVFNQKSEKDSHSVYTKMDYVGKLLKDYAKSHVVSSCLIYRASESLHFYGHANDADVAYLWWYLFQQRKWFSKEDEPFFVEMRKALIDKRVPFSAILALMQAGMIASAPRSLTHHEQQPAFIHTLPSNSALFIHARKGDFLSSITAHENAEDLKPLIPFLFSLDRPCEDDALGSFTDFLGFDTSSWMEFAFNWINHEDPVFCEVGWYLYLNTPGLRFSKQRVEAIAFEISKLFALEPKVRERILRNIKLICLRSAEGQKLISALDLFLMAPKAEQTGDFWIQCLLESRNPDLIKCAYEMFQHSISQFKKKTELLLLQSLSLFHPHLAWVHYSKLKGAGHFTSQMARKVFKNLICSSNRATFVPSEYRDLYLEMVQLLENEKRGELFFSQAILKLITAMRLIPPLKNESLHLLRSASEMRGLDAPTIARLWFERMEKLFAQVIAEEARDLALHFLTTADKGYFAHLDSASKEHLEQIRSTCIYLLEFQEPHRKRLNELLEALKEPTSLQVVVPFIQSLLTQKMAKKEFDDEFLHLSLHLHDLAPEAAKVHRKKIQAALGGALGLELVQLWKLFEIRLQLFVSKEGDRQLILENSVDLFVASKRAQFTIPPKCTNWLGTHSLAILETFKRDENPQGAYQFMLSLEKEKRSNPSMMPYLIWICQNWSLLEFSSKELFELLSLHPELIGLIGQQPWASEFCKALAEGILIEDSRSLALAGLPYVYQIASSEVDLICRYAEKLVDKKCVMEALCLLLRSEWSLDQVAIPAALFFKMSRQLTLTLENIHEIFSYPTLPALLADNKNTFIEEVVEYLLSQNSENYLRLALDTMSRYEDCSEAHWSALFKKLLNQSSVSLATEAYVKFQALKDKIPPSDDLCLNLLELLDRYHHPALLSYLEDELKIQDPPKKLRACYILAMYTYKYEYCEGTTAHHQQILSHLEIFNSLYSTIKQPSIRVEKEVLDRIERYSQEVQLVICHLLATSGGAQDRVKASQILGQLPPACHTDNQLILLMQRLSQENWEPVEALYNCVNLVKEKNKETSKKAIALLLENPTKKSIKQAIVLLTIAFEKKDPRDFQALFKQLFENVLKGKYRIDSPDFVQLIDKGLEKCGLPKRDSNSLILRFLESYFEIVDQNICWNEQKVKSALDLYLRLINQVSDVPQHLESLPKHLPKIAFLILLLYQNPRMQFYCDDQKTFEQYVWDVLKVGLISNLRCNYFKIFFAELTRFKFPLVIQSDLIFGFLHEIASAKKEKQEIKRFCTDFVVFLEVFAHSEEIPPSSDFFNFQINEGVCCLAADTKGINPQDVQQLESKRTAAISSAIQEAQVTKLFKGDNEGIYHLCKLVKAPYHGKINPKEEIAYLHSLYQRIKNSRCNSADQGIEQILSCLSTLCPESFLSIAQETMTQYPSSMVPAIILNQISIGSNRLLSNSPFANDAVALIRAIIENIYTYMATQKDLAIQHYILIFLIANGSFCEENNFTNYIYFYENLGKIFPWVLHYLKLKPVPLHDLFEESSPPFHQWKYFIFCQPVRILSQEEEQLQLRVCQAVIENLFHQPENQEYYLHTIMAITLQATKLNLLHIKEDFMRFYCSILDRIDSHQVQCRRLQFYSKCIRYVTIDSTLTYSQKLVKLEELILFVESIPELDDLRVEQAIVKLLISCSDVVEDTISFYHQHDQGSIEPLIQRALSIAVRNINRVAQVGQSNVLVYQAKMRVRADFLAKFFFELVHAFKFNDHNASAVPLMREINELVLKYGAILTATLALFELAKLRFNRSKVSTATVWQHLKELNTRKIVNVEANGYIFGELIGSFDSSSLEELWIAHVNGLIEKELTDSVKLNLKQHLMEFHNRITYMKSFHGDVEISTLVLRLKGGTSDDDL